MSTKNYWTSANDFDEDLLSLSDFCAGPPQKKHTLPDEHVRKTRTKKSLYEDPSDEEEDRPPMIGTGRGFPLIKNSERRPGGVPTFFSEQSQIEKEIRQVCGGAFSNDIIENSLKTEEKQYSRLKCPPQMPDISLTRSPASDSSSKYSTPASSPLPVFSDESPVRSASHKQEVVVTNSKVNPNSIYSQHKQKMDGSGNQAPPPIYDILRCGQSRVTQKLHNGNAQQTKKSEDNAAHVCSTILKVGNSRVPQKLINGNTRRREKPEDYTVGLSNVSNRTKPFNLNSKNDFPDLR